MGSALRARTRRHARERARGDARMNAARVNVNAASNNGTNAGNNALTICPFDEDNDADDADHANVAAGSRESADAMNASCAAPDVAVRLLKQVSMVRRRFGVYVCVSMTVRGVSNVYGRRLMCSRSFLAIFIDICTAAPCLAPCPIDRWQV